MNDRNVKEPVTCAVKDILQPVTLRQSELTGEIGRRINDLIFHHYLKIDIQKHFLEPFRSRPFTEGRHYIGIGKLIDAGSLFTAYTDDPSVNERTKHLIDDLMLTRDTDGYIGVFKPEEHAFQNHRNWTLHEQEYLLLGLVRHWSATGNVKSLQYARDLGDYIMLTFSQDTKPEEVCTAGLPEAFLALYTQTGNKRYLRFAAEIRHGNSSHEIKCASLLDWQQSFDSKPAHVYVMLARCYAQLELYRLMGIPSLIDMTRYMRQELLRQGGGLNVIGSASDGEYFSYTQNGAGTIGESCVTAYLLRWLDSLMRLEGDLQYGDIMERTIFNALFAAQDPKGRKIRYFTPFTGQRNYFEQDGFCCPGNYRRIVAELPQRVYYRFGDHGIAVNLYSASHTTIAFDEGAFVTLSQQTDYPNSGHITIMVTPSEEMAFRMYLRIPRWCSDATISINYAAPVHIQTGTRLYEINRSWKANDIVILDLPMTWRLIKGHQMQEGKVALLRGPVVYCLGTGHNADFIRKYASFHGAVVDPSSFGEPETDATVRPGGKKVKALARVEAEGGWSQGAPQETLVFSEFIDPTGIMTYFHVLDLDAGGDDELITQ